MINELKPIKSEPNEPSKMTLWESQLVDLGDHLLSVNEAKFDYRGKTLVLRGLPQRFTIFLDGALVCDVSYGHIHNTNESLIQELME